MSEMTLDDCKELLAQMQKIISSRDLSEYKYEDINDAFSALKNFAQKNSETRKDILSFAEEVLATPKILSSTKGYFHYNQTFDSVAETMGNLYSDTYRILEAVGKDSKCSKQAISAIQKGLKREGNDMYSYQSAYQALGEIAKENPDTRRNIFHIMKTTKRNHIFGDTVREYSELLKNLELENSDLKTEVFAEFKKMLETHSTSGLSDNHDFVYNDLNEILEKNPNLAPEILSAYPKNQTSNITGMNLLEKIALSKPELAERSIDFIQTRLEGEEKTSMGLMHYYNILEKIVEKYPDKAEKVLSALKSGAEATGHTYIKNPSTYAYITLGQIAEQRKDLTPEILNTMKAFLQLGDKDNHSAYGIIGNIISRQPEFAKEALDTMKVGMKELENVGGKEYSETLPVVYYALEEVAINHPKLVDDVLDVMKSGLKSELNWANYEDEDEYERGNGFQKAYWSLRNIGKNVSDEKTLLAIDGLMASIPGKALLGEVQEIRKEKALTEEFRIRDYPKGIGNVVSGKELTEGMSYSPTMLDINELFEKGVILRGDKIDLKNYPEINCIQAAEQEQLDMLTPESKQQITAIHLSNNTPVEWFEDYINADKMSTVMDMRSFSNLQKFETHCYCNNDLKEVKLPENVESIAIKQSYLDSLNMLPIDAIPSCSRVNGYVYKDDSNGVVRGEFCTATARRLKLKEEHIAEKQAQVKEWKQQRNDKLLNNVKTKISPAVEETKEVKAPVKGKSGNIKPKGKEFKI